MVLSVFGARLVQLQGVDPKSYAEMAAAEGMVAVDLPAERGDILDRNGEPLAASIDGMMVVADPLMTADQAPELAKFLANRLDVDYFTILPRLREEGSRFEYIARTGARRRSPPRSSRRPTEAGFDGPRHPPRPGPRLPGPRRGRQPDRLHRHRRGAGRVRAHLRRAARRHRRLGPLRRRRRQPDPARREHGRASRSTAPTCTPRSTSTCSGTPSACCARPSRTRGPTPASPWSCTRETGEIMALADHPTFDASQPLLAPEEDLGSRAMSDVYEPGSVEKALTLSALIDAGKVTPAHPDPGAGVPAHRDGRTIGDWFPHGRIRLTLAGVLAKSSNIGTVLAADKFARGELRRYLSAFGLGSAPTSAYAARPRASCPTRACGAAWSRTGSPSASRSRSTPSRWRRPSTPSPTTGSGSRPA